MSVRIERVDGTGTIAAVDLPEGVLAEIVSFRGQTTGGDELCLGRIVRRVRETLEVMGADNVVWYDKQVGYQVRVLPPGTRFRLDGLGWLLVDRSESATEGTIRLTELRDGQLAEIVGDTIGMDPAMIDRVVQKHGGYLGGVGQHTLETLPPALAENIRLRVLPNGTRLIVEDNE